MLSLYQYDLPNRVQFLIELLFYPSQQIILRSTKMHRKFALFLQSYLILLLFQRISTDNCQDIRKLCFDQNRCADCIQIHHCCNWCYDEVGLYMIFDIKTITNYNFSD